MGSDRITLFVGSPRKKGTSFSFARTLKQLAENQGHPAEIVNIIEYYDGHRNFPDLKAILKSTDIIGLVMPMYVDTLPAPVIWFLEQVSAEYPDELRGKSLFAVIQCGFPDVTLLQPSLESCRFVAMANSLQWLGGIGYGGGAIINGTYMEDLGKKGQTIIFGFSLAVEDIVKGRSIRSEVQDMLTVRIPKIVYWPLAVVLNHRSRKLAKQNGVKQLRGKVLLVKK